MIGKATEAVTAFTTGRYAPVIESQARAAHARRWLLAACKLNGPAAKGNNPRSDPQWLYLKQAVKQDKCISLLRRKVERVGRGFQHCL